MSFSLARLAAATARSAAAAPMRASGAVAPARAGVAPSKVVVRNMGGLNPKTFSHNSHFHVSSVHKNTGMFMATVMWLWVFYRAKEDAIWVLVRVEMANTDDRHRSTNTPAPPPPLLSTSLTPTHIGTTGLCAPVGCAPAPPPRAHSLRAGGDWRADHRRGE
mmetsp:Transcript_56305/g.155378  ORF Transcript_56305/g.155378 Transcript_56305/m.155378 type:complete len:162 (-) Transcript_56305:511-996(-)